MNFKFNLFLFFFIIFFHHTRAQSGINTQNPLSTLDIVSLKSNEKALTIYNSLGKQAVSLSGNGRLSIGDLQPSVTLDLRNSDVLTNGGVGVGTTSKSATEMGAGALKYDVTAKNLYFSDGLQWNPVYSTVMPLSVILNVSNGSSQSFPYYGTTVINSWNVVENGENSYNASTGEFVAPRDGIYTVSANITMASTQVRANSYIELQLVSPTLTVKSQTDYYSIASVYPSVFCSGNFQLTKGQKIKIQLFQNLGSTLYLRKDYCILTINEN